MSAQKIMSENLTELKKDMICVSFDLGNTGGRTS